ncbi:hypothetical protein [Yoonia sp. 2307UL14-13]|uniref:hypothetical protein n=1 Tax=Yoonia sp. 2307UL14-13 TaxID=3126506 RepID=UPI0030996525
MVDAADDLFELHPHEASRYGDKPSDLVPLLHQFADEVWDVGLSDPELRARMMILAFIKYPKPWPAFLELPMWQQIRERPGQANDLFEDFCAKLKYIARQDRATIEVWW